MRDIGHDIQTARLCLRRCTPADLNELFAIRSDSEVGRFLSGNPTSEEVLAAINRHQRCWQEHGFGNWGVVLINSPGLIGWCGLDFLDATTEVEVGYGLAPQYWGRGIATEAAEASLRYGFETLSLERIVAVAYPQNKRSRHVMEKLGMKYRKNGFYYGTDMVYYEISRADFAPSASEYILRDNQ